MSSTPHSTQPDRQPVTTARRQSVPTRSAALLLAVGSLALLLAGCGTPHRKPPTSRPVPAARDTPSKQRRPVHPPVRSGWHQRGIASWYGGKFHGRRTASGERFDMHARTAAHRKLPFGTLVRVTSERTGRHVVVRINDRGPFVGGRVIDLSRGAAQKLGMIQSGVERVRLEIVRPA